MAKKKSTPHASQEIANECLAVRVRLLSRTLTRIYDEALRPLGMTAAQMNLLVLVSNHGPIGQAEISRQLNLEKSTLSRNVERMRTQGWIVTSPSGAGRGRVLDLTAAGVKQLETSRPLWDAAQVEARGLLGERDARSLKRIADSLWATLGQN